MQVLFTSRIHDEAYADGWLETNEIRECLKSASQAARIAFPFITTQ